MTARSVAIYLVTAFAFCCGAASGVNYAHLFQPLPPPAPALVVSIGGPKGPSVMTCYMPQPTEKEKNAR